MCTVSTISTQVRQEQQDGQVQRQPLQRRHVRPAVRATGRGEIDRIIDTMTNIFMLIAIEIKITLNGSQFNP